jgi:hypothetical protein
MREKERKSINIKFDPKKKILKISNLQLWNLYFDLFIFYLKKKEASERTRER